jgi:prefoldin subunit 5
MTIVELKAQAYDILAQIQYLQQELNKVNEAIANYKEDTTNGTTAQVGNPQAQS